MPPPELVLHGGKIITLDRGSRIAQAIAVRHGRIQSVGDDAAVLSLASPTTRRVDLAGRAVLPGLIDAHPHADREGLKARGGIPIAGLHSVASIVDVVKRAAAVRPPGEWIVLMPMGEAPHEYVSRPDQLRAAMILMRRHRIIPFTFARYGDGGAAGHFRPSQIRWRSGGRASPAIRRRRTTLKS